MNSNKATKNSKARICPISGEYKARRHAVARKVWDKLSEREKDQMRLNQQEYLKKKGRGEAGSLRQYRARQG